MSWTLVSGATLIVAPWRNGHGTSREVAQGAGWILSVADLERDCPFSDYPGMDRVFTPIAGAIPPALAFDGGPFEPCPLLVPKAFPGDLPTMARIPAAGRAFNLIFTRAALRATVEVRRLDVGDVAVLHPAAMAAAYCVSGEATVDERLSIMPGDTVLGIDPAGPATLTASTAAVLILVVLARTSV